MYFNFCDSFFENSLFNLLDDNLLNYHLIPDFSLNTSIYHTPSMYIYTYSLGKQSSTSSGSESGSESEFSPNINVSEDENRYYIHTELPGITKNQVKIEYDEDNHSLILSGERKPTKSFNENEIKPSSEVANDYEANKNQNTEDNQNNSTEENTESKINKENKITYIKKEIQYGKFFRRYSIPKDANIDSIQAKMENGVLEIIIDKNQKSKNKIHTIEIQ